MRTPNGHDGHRRKQHKYLHDKLSVNDTWDAFKVLSGCSTARVSKNSALRCHTTSAVVSSHWSKPSQNILSLTLFHLQDFLVFVNQT